MGNIVALHAAPQEQPLTIETLIDRTRAMDNAIYAAQEKLKRETLREAGSDADGLFVALSEIRQGSNRQRGLIRAGWHAARLATTCRSGSRQTQNLGLRDLFRSWAIQADEISRALETVNLEAL